MISYQWTTAVISLLLAGLILFLVRRNHLHGLHAVWWLTAALGVLVLGLFPRLLDHIGVFLGVSYPPILFVVLGVGMLLVKVLTMDLERSRQERMLRRLAQRLALLEMELQECQRVKQEHWDDMQ